MREFRFAVGAPDGPRSTVWKIWTHRSEAYIQSRMMGASTKISLHNPEVTQWSMTSQWFGENMPDRPNSDRHIQRWNRPIPRPGEAAHVFRIVVPGTELRQVQLNEKLTKVTWLPAPALGHAVNVECYITPPVDRRTFNFPYVHLATLDFTEDRFFVALHHNDEVTEDSARELVKVRRAALRQAIERGQALEPEFRAVAFFVDAVGVRGMIEFVPFIADDESA